MNISLVLTILIVLGAIIFDFINGFHDTANAIATSVSTKALTPRQATYLAAIMNMIGAMTFTGVAKTITSGIVDPYQLQNGSIVILSALLASIIWNLITWYYGIPSSSSHAIIGAITGASIVASGLHAINLQGIIKIMETLIISPVLSCALGYIVYTLLKVLFQKLDLSKTNKRLRSIQVITAGMQAFTHGTNDAQKSMGIITLALLTNGYITSIMIPLWVQLCCTFAIGLGTFFGGWRIIKTIGTQIIKMRPINGVAADLTGTSIILSATLYHLPISTTHVISSAILGVGSAQQIKSVHWKTAQRIVFTWIITLPIAALIAAIIYSLLHLFFQF